VAATGAGGTVVAESAPGVSAKACIVPALVGKTVAAAKKALTKSNCATGKTTTRTSTKKAGTVIATSPAKGKNVAAGTKVALTVAKT
jgi:beta-lactam-binding protein with PASTA domain